MKRTFILLAIFLLPLQGNPVWGDDANSCALEGMREKYGNLPGLTVAYSREVITRSMSLLGNQVKGDLATGRIFYRPPCYLKLLQETPEPETIIADRDRLWWYIPRDKMVREYRSKKFGKELRLLADIFTGLKDVEERFEVKIEAPGREGECRIELTPDPAWGEIDRITLSVTGGHYIRRLDIRNTLGTTSRFILKKMKIIEKFEADFFHFTLPEGARLVLEGD